MENFYHKGYLVEFNVGDHDYVIKKDGNIIFECEQKFPFPSEAEVHAKLCINRLTANKDGWIVS